MLFFINVDKYNTDQSDQFEIVEFSESLTYSIVINGLRKSRRLYIDVKRMYDRIVIYKKACV